MTPRLAAFLLVFVALAAAVRAEEKPPAANATARDLPARIETRHSLTLNGRALDYRAVAETTALSDAKGDTTASLYTIAYLAEAPAEQPRPVAFVFNGGPGAASVFLHLGALGPKVIDTPEDGAVPGPPIRLVDNPATWLAFTDLVFVDPVGTGFSHGKGKDDNPDKPFWNVRSDLDSLASLVRLWLTHHQRWSSPVYLVGESYGGLRAAALSRSLNRDAGVAVSGMVLVSPALDVAILHPDVTDVLAAAFELPSFAAAAAVLSGKPADVAAAEGFALSDYLSGLIGIPGRPAAGDPFLARVAGMIGLPEEVVRRERGRVGGQVFVREVRRPQGDIMSLYDATVGRPTQANPWGDHAGDPILDTAVAAYTQAFDIYAPEALGYRTDQPYRVLPHDVSRQWNWDAARDGEGGLGIALASLQATLLQYPRTRLMIANGRYDLVTPYLGSRWLIDQLSIPAAQRAAIALRVYEGGHMMYTRPRVRAALAADAAAVFAPDNGVPQH